MCGRLHRLQRPDLLPARPARGDAHQLAGLRQPCEYHLYGSGSAGRSQCRHARAALRRQRRAARRQRLVGLHCPAMDRPQRLQQHRYGACRHRSGYLRARRRERLGQSAMHRYGLRAGSGRHFDARSDGGVAARIVRRPEPRPRYAHHHRCQQYRCCLLVAFGFTGRQHQPAGHDRGVARHDDDLLPAGRCGAMCRGAARDRNGMARACGQLLRRLARLPDRQYHRVLHRRRFRKCHLYVELRRRHGHSRHGAGSAPGLLVRYGATFHHARGRGKRLCVRCLDRTCPGRCATVAAPGGVCRRNHRRPHLCLVARGGRLGL